MTTISLARQRSVFFASLSFIQQETLQRLKSSGLTVWGPRVFIVWQFAYFYIYFLWWHYKSKGQVVPNPYQGDPTFVFPQLFSIFSLVPKRSVNYQFCLGSFASLQTYCPTTLPYFRQDIRMFRQNVCMFRHPIFLGVDAFSFQQNRRVSNLSKW